MAIAMTAAHIRIRKNGLIISKHQPIKKNRTASWIIVSTIFLKVKLSVFWGLLGSIVSLFNWFWILHGPVTFYFDRMNNLIFQKYFLVLIRIQISASFLNTSSFSVFRGSR